MKKLLILTALLMGFTVVNLQAQTGAESKPKVEESHAKEGPTTGPDAPHHHPHAEEHPGPASDGHTAPPPPAEHPAPNEGPKHPTDEAHGHEGHHHPPGVEHSHDDHAAPKEKAPSKEPK